VVTANPVNPVDAAMGRAAGDALTKLRDELRRFAADRDWDQFHKYTDLPPCSN
jgi:hypothetical protein